LSYTISLPLNQKQPHYIETENVVTWLKPTLNSEAGIIGKCQLEENLNPVKPSTAGENFSKWIGRRTLVN
jgi:hypothetical protein